MAGSCLSDCLQLALSADIWPLVRLRGQPDLANHGSTRKANAAGWLSSSQVVISGRVGGGQSQNECKQEARKKLLV